MLFVDGGNDRVGIGKSSPGSTLHIEDNSNYTLKVSKSGSNIHAAQFASNGTAALGIAVDDSNNQVRLNSEGSNDSLVLEVADGTDGLIIDSAGHVTKPNQSAFLVSPSSTLSNVTGDNTNYDVVFATEILDRNADFSSATFTAPVTGIYAFHAILEIEGVTDSMTQCVAFFNASNRSYYIKNDDGGNYHTSGGLYVNTSAVIDMDANDTVTLQIDFRNGSKVVDVGSGSYWGGYLVA